MDTCLFMFFLLFQQSSGSKNDSSGRITGLKLVELVAKKERSLCKENIEIVLAHLLLLGYLQVSLHSPSKVIWNEIYEQSFWLVTWIYYGANKGIISIWF